MYYGAGRIIWLWTMGQGAEYIYVLWVEPSFDYMDQSKDDDD